MNTLSEVSAFGAIFLVLMLAAVCFITFTIGSALIVIMNWFVSGVFSYYNRISWFIIEMIKKVPKIGFTTKF